MAAGWPAFTGFRGHRRNWTKTRRRRRSRRFSRRSDGGFSEPRSSAANRLGMANSVPFNRDQSFRLPPGLKDRPPNDAMAHSIVAAVDRVPLSAFPVSGRTQPQRPYACRPPPETKPPRRITEPSRIAMKAESATGDGRKRQGKRGQRVEPVFLIIKSASGFIRFHRRGRCQRGKRIDIDHHRREPREASSPAGRSALQQRTRCNRSGLRQSKRLQARAGFPNVKAGKGLFGYSSGYAQPRHLPRLLCHGNGHG